MDELDLNQIPAGAPQARVSDQLAVLPKDDNAHLEQKNWMWLRHLLGSGRLEDPLVVPQIIGFYKKVCGPATQLLSAFHETPLPSVKIPALKIKIRRDP